jgi:hypothetical protein
MLVVTLAIGAQAAAASARSGPLHHTARRGMTGEVAAVKAAWKQMFLAEYFGPPAKLCAMMTAGEQRWFERNVGARSCTGAARSLEHVVRACPSINGIAPGTWRSDAAFYLRRLRVRLRSAVSAETVDTALGDTETLVKRRNRWLFSNGLFFMQC